MPESQHTVRNGLLCAFAFLACALIAQPFVQMGFMDDWSYIWSAREFARTGHLAYVWSSPILGWQIPWGALFIKLFGFSFIAVRLSALPIAMITVFLFHSILIRFGATARNAILGALTFALSPLFLPIAVSFMTDVPGICSILLCIYICQRSAAAQSDGHTILWLLLAAFTNLLSGTVRQTSWLGLLIIIPSTAILLRNRRGVLLTAALSWITGAVFIAACMRWFSSQPGALHEHVFHGAFKDPSHPFVYLFFQLLGSLLLVLTLLFPLLAPWLMQTRSLSKAAWARALGASALLSLLQWKLRWMIPWIFYVIALDFTSSANGPVLGITNLDLALPASLSIAFAAVVIIAAVLAAEYIFAMRHHSSPEGHQPLGANWSAFLWITGPYALCYLLLLFPRGLYDFIYDRYLLGVFPILIVAFVLCYQRFVRLELPRISIALLVCFAFLAIAGAHDWFAAYRARLVAINQLLASGIPRAQLQGGFEYDSWTRVENLHYLDPIPKSVLVTAEGCTPDFTPLGRSASQQFTVIYLHKPCLAPADLPPIPYTAWLPPFHRAIFTSRIRPNTQAAPIP